MNERADSAQSALQKSVHASVSRNHWGFEICRSPGSDIESSLHNPESLMWQGFCANRNPVEGIAGFRHINA